MGNVIRKITATIRIDIDQEIALSEEELQLLEDHLKNDLDIPKYISQNGGLVINPLWEIIYSEIDLDCQDCDDLKNVELEEL